MRCWWLLLAVPAAGLAQSPTPPVPVSLQRESIRRQVQSVTLQSGAAVPGHWFTYNWAPEPIAPITPLKPEAAAPAPPSNTTATCDPLPPDQIAPLIDSAASKSGVPRNVLHAVITRESGFRPCAVSSKGAQGLMQLMPATAVELGVADPFDPAQNVEAGARLLQQLLTRYNGNLELALSAYNAGAGAVDRAGGVPPFAETRTYVVEILKKLFY